MDSQIFIAYVLDQIYRMVRVPLTVNCEITPLYVEIKISDGFIFLVQRWTDTYVKTAITATAHVDGQEMARKFNKVLGDTDDN